MQSNQIVEIGDVVAVTISRETLNAVGLKAGDEVSISEHSLAMRSTAEVVREREIKASAKKIFERHHTAFERLAPSARRQRKSGF